MPDLSQAFHVYAVTWTADSIVWSFDGAPVYAVATPADLHQPMFLLLKSRGRRHVDRVPPTQRRRSRRASRSTAFRVFVPPDGPQETRR